MNLQKSLQVACENVRRDSTSEVSSLETTESWPVGFSHENCSLQTLTDAQGMLGLWELAVLVTMTD